MDVIWLDPERADRRDAAGAVAVFEAARQVDAPEQLGATVSSFCAGLRYGWDGDPAVTAVVRGANGRVVGVLEVTLPHWDNTHVGSVDVTVDPIARRQGIGTALFDAGVERIKAAGRRLVLTQSYDLPPAVGFAKAMGLDQASAEVQRRQDLPDLVRLDQVYDDAVDHATGYELVRLPGPIPEHLMADVVRMTAAINDAPTDQLDIEDEVFSPERIRAFETAQAAHRRRIYRLVSRERDTGVLAGHTVVAVDGERPWHAWQFDTSVLRSHRGHRLGVLLKIGMLRWLAEEEPQLWIVDTWNAASNTHMIRVNELLGYRVLAHGMTWQRHLDNE